jgi:biotin operon repressor
LKYSLKNRLKFYQQSVSGLPADLHQPYDLLQILKSINKTDNGKPIAFNSFHKSEKKKLAELIGIPLSTFSRALNKAIKLDWITVHGEYYNIKSIYKINNNHFKTHKFKNQKDHHYYYRLLNIQGIDLQAHRIHFQIIRSSDQFRHVVKQGYLNPTTQPNGITSTSNQKIVDSISQTKANKYVKYFALSMDTISNRTGISKKEVFNKIKQMKIQGLKMITDKSKFNRHTKRECNKYDCHSFDWLNQSFALKFEKTKKKTVKVLTPVKSRFENLLNNTKFRIVLINNGMLSNNYLKYNKSGRLISIPVRCWSNILYQIISSKDKLFKRVLEENGITDNNLFISPSTTTVYHANQPDYRFRYQIVDKAVVKLVDDKGNYSPSLLNAYVPHLRYNNTLGC